MILRSNRVSSYEMYKLVKTEQQSSTKEETIQDRLIDTTPKMINYLNKGLKQSQNGASVVCTGKQFVCTINPFGGEAGHISAIARTITELRGIHSGLSFSDASQVYNSEGANYLRVRIESERVSLGLIESCKMLESGDRQSQIKLIDSCIRVYYKGSISAEEYNSFKQFVNTLGQPISRLPFSYYVFNEGKEGQKTYPKLKSLEELLICLESAIDVNKKPYVHPCGELIIDQKCALSNDTIEKTRAM